MGSRSEGEALACKLIQPSPREGFLEHTVNQLLYAAEVSCDPHKSDHLSFGTCVVQLTRDKDRIVGVNLEEGAWSMDAYNFVVEVQKNIYCHAGISTTINGI